ncbi:ABC transporter permease [Paenibacillus antri]|uniref:ABC transporter permease n=1 Tax=Paenibacillus antri TaxID=2582848 RepID=A0A5R9G6T3_9BACL|nr:ABC transporter permease subunit [Paenibacillus antri]TLS50769.1 ABC transporter permease [Paenibacillus antri]
MIRQWTYLTGEELRKLFRGSKLIVLLLLSFFIGVLFVLIGGYLGLDGNVSLIALKMMLAVLLPLFMASLGSELMVTEWKDGTIKNALKLPLSREMIYLGKLSAGWTAGALIVLSVFIPTFLGGLLLGGMPSPSAIGATVATYASAVVFCGLLLILSNSVSLWAGSSGVGLVACVLIWMGMSFVGLFEPEYSRFFVTGYADWLQPLLRGGDAGTSLSMLLFMTAYYIIGTILGMLAFQRKEI